MPLGLRRSTGWQKSWAFSDICAPPTDILTTFTFLKRPKGAPSPCFRCAVKRTGPEKRKHP
jgi:hypothetical protein